MDIQGSRTLKQGLQNTANCLLFGKNVSVGLIFKCKDINSALAYNATSAYTCEAKLL